MQFVNFTEVMYLWVVFVMDLPNIHYYSKVWSKIFFTENNAFIQQGSVKGSSDATCTFTSCLKCVLAVCTQPPYNDKVQAVQRPLEGQVLKV